MHLHRRPSVYCTCEILRVHFAQDISKPAMAALISQKARSTAPEALEKAFGEWLGDLRVLQEAGPGAGILGFLWFFLV